MNDIRKYLKYLFSSCMILLMGCTTPERTAIVTANEIHEIAISEQQIISNYCIPKYSKAQSRPEIDKIDQSCLPLKKAYENVQADWKTLVSIIKMSQAGDMITEEQIITATKNLVNSITNLQQLVEIIK